MVKISFNGACGEVGRSAFLIESEETDDKILLDYGIKMSDADNNFPLHVSSKDLTAIVITHSHIDHVGGIPIFYISGSVPLYTHRLTFEISQLLLRDMMKISEFFLPFDKEALVRMRKYARFLNHDVRKKIGKSTYITLLNAGHIPGSAMVLLEMDGKKILYTGDINTIETQLMVPAVPPLEEIDFLIMESTYGSSDHEDRKKVEQEFIEHINTVLDNNGKVLVPAFGVSRSQEVLLVLNKYGIEKPVFVDGIARRISRIYEEYGNCFRSFEELVQAFNKGHFIVQRNSYRERTIAKNTNGVVIAPSGMLKGGTSRMYAENIINDPNSAIYLVSYQIPGTPGAILLEEKKYATGSSRNRNSNNTDNEPHPVSAEVKFFDFSSHSGKKELIEFANGCKFRNGDKAVFLVHGEPESSEELSKSLSSLGLNPSIPKLGDVVKL